MRKLCANGLIGCRFRSKSFATELRHADAEIRFKLSKRRVQDPRLSNKHVFQYGDGAEFILNSFSLSHDPLIKQHGRSLVS